jgi:hypothetical protein
MINCASSQNQSSALYFSYRPPTSQSKEVGEIFARTIEPLRVASPFYRLLTDPVQLVLGGMWGTFIAIGAYSLVQKIQELKVEIAHDRSVVENYEKINQLAKKILVDLLGFVGSCSYTIHWAHQAQLLSLGQYAPIFRGLGLGSSLIINGVDSGAAIYQIYLEKEAIQAEPNAIEQEKHKQQLCLALMRLISNVSMVAWTALSAATIITGICLSPILMTAIIGISGIFSVAAYFYDMGIKNQSEGLLGYNHHTNHSLSGVT